MRQLGIRPRRCRRQQRRQLLAGLDAAGPGAVAAAQRRRLAGRRGVADHLVAAGPAAAGAARWPRAASRVRGPAGRGAEGRPARRAGPAAGRRRLDRPHPRGAGRRGQGSRAGCSRSAWPAPSTPSTEGDDRWTPLTRRRFLIASGVVGGGALAAGATAYALRDILATAGDRPGRRRAPWWCVTLYGGNDGLNTVIPYADPAYQDARPGAGLRRRRGAAARRRDRAQPGAEGAAPALRRQDAWRSSAASATRSRTAATSGRWTSGRPPSRSGPAPPAGSGRWLDGAGGDPRLAVSFEPVLPPLLAGATQRRRRGAGSTGREAARGGHAECSPALGAGRRPASRALQARAAACFADLARGRRDDHGGARRPPTPTPTRTTRRPPPATGTGGRAALDAQLDLVAQCVEAGVATRVYSVSLGGFDTHADEKQRAGDAARPAGPAADRVRRPDGEDRGGRKVVVRGLLRVRPPGAGQRLATAPTTAPRPTCSCSARASRGGLLRRAAQPHRPRRRRPQVHASTSATSTRRCSPTCSAPTRRRCWAAGAAGWASWAEGRVLDGFDPPDVSWSPPVGGCLRRRPTKRHGCPDGPGHADPGVEARAGRCASTAGLKG